MQNFPLVIPPGVVRAGTENQVRGRWWETSLVRWYGKKLGPIGGFRSRSDAQVAVTGRARAILPWRTTVGSRWLAIGCESKLYAQNPTGVNYDITPAGLIAGNADQLAGAGFGQGLFGAGTWGTPRPDTGNPTPATVWDLDVFGNDLVACSSSDGGLYAWTLNTAVAAAAISGAPTGCAGLVVSQEGFLIALGAGGDPRKVKWADQGSLTSWTPSSTSQAGDKDLVTSGALVKGLRLGGVVLLLTDVDAHAITYVGLPEVHNIQPVGYGCGAISKGCVVAMGSQAAWWSRSGVWLFDGQSAQPIDCPVYDFLQADLNQGQRTKISGFHNSALGELWWFYPSSASSENDSYVFWDYRKSAELGTPVWGLGKLGRLSACEVSVFSRPLAMATDGLCYEHEVGFNWGGATPYAKAAVQIGNGERNIRVLGIVPDEEVAGEAKVTFRTRRYPNSPQATIATVTFDGSGRTDCRFEACQIELDVQFIAAAAGRWGDAALQGVPGSVR